LSSRSSGDLPTLLAVLLAGTLLRPAGVACQQPEIWNDGRVLALVARARDLRSSSIVDSTLFAYQAEARGYVYFYIDRPDSDERTLVKADQIALEVYWRAPNWTKQRIVGLRDEKVLPTNIRYHLDHLTVVQDDFGETIRLGDGDEVSAVLHPMAPGAPEVYDFGLADSLSLRYGGGLSEVRVYEVRVRPKDPDRPGFVGSVYLDRSTAAIVRMAFTFTPASYVDPHLDYIRIALDNSLWEEKHWLPYRQEVQLRRELPILDFLAGSIIQGRFDIGRYEFNPDLPDVLFRGRGVSALPEAQRAAFPFERGLFDDLEEEGLAPTPSIEEIRTQARRILADRALSGLAPLRLHLGSFSDGIRYNRAEGLFLGGGLQIRPLPRGVVRLSGGYAFGANKPLASVSLSDSEGPVAPALELFWDRLRDVGPLPAAAPAISTLGALLFREDYLDPYRVRGLRLTLKGLNAGIGPRVTFRWERHRSVERVLSDAFRPVHPVEEGVLGAVQLAAPFNVVRNGTAEVLGAIGHLGARTFASGRVSARWSSAPRGRAWQTSLDLRAGVATAETPVQELFHLGGRGTLAGHDFRSFTGNSFFLTRIEGTRALFHPWAGIRAFVALGATRLSPASTLPAGWDSRGSRGLRATVGLGLSLGWDVLRLDVARGFPDGSWELVFSVDRQFHAWL
jgi:hypothetical protein